MRANGITILRDYEQGNTVQGHFNITELLREENNYIWYIIQECCNNKQHLKYFIQQNAASCSYEEDPQKLISCAHINSILQEGINTKLMREIQMIRENLQISQIMVSTSEFEPLSFLESHPEYEFLLISVFEYFLSFIDDCSLAIDQIIEIISRTKSIEISSSVFNLLDRKVKQSDKGVFYKAFHEVREFSETSYYESPIKYAYQCSVENLSYINSGKHIRVPQRIVYNNKGDQLAINDKNSFPRIIGTYHEGTILENNPARELAYILGTKYQPVLEHSSEIKSMLELLHRVAGDPVMRSFLTNLPNEPRFSNIAHMIENRKRPQGMDTSSIPNELELLKKILIENLDLQDEDIKLIEGLAWGGEKSAKNFCWIIITCIKNLIKQDIKITLYEKYVSYIQSGIKNLELRLDTGRFKNIAIEDTILFHSNSNTIRVKIIGIQNYKDLDTLYKDNIEYLNRIDPEFDDTIGLDEFKSRIYQIYSSQGGKIHVEKYGIRLFDLKLIDESQE